MGRGRECRFPREPREIPIGNGEVLASGERVALLGYGYGVVGGAGGGRASSPSHDLQPTVADARFAKPLDSELAERLALDHDLLVTIEENVLPGGFGSAVLEHLEDAFAERPGSAPGSCGSACPDRYVTHGKPALLRAEVGLTGESVAERVLAALARRRARPRLSLHQSAQSHSVRGGSSVTVVSGVTTGRRAVSLYVWVRGRPRIHFG